MNNRQNGRRRGRGGQQARNGQPGGPDRGNRLDNRARGNAAQLLEKYKTLARDAQMQGDRVNTEYYLQFADHYFRVLSESRARFEEQRPARQNDRDDFGDEDGDQQRAQNRDDEDDGGDEGEQRREESRDERRGGGQPRARRSAQDDRRANQDDSDEGAREGAREGNRERGRRNGAPVNGHGANGNGGEFAAPDFLAEPLSVRAEAEGDDAAAEGEAKPRRRTRRPRTESAAAEA